MPNLTPFASSGPPTKRSRIPRTIRQACEMLVFGLPDDVEGKPVDFIAAAAKVGISAPVMRKWLHRPEIRTYLQELRQSYLSALTASNPKAVARVRDKEDGNQMAQVAASRLIETMGETDRVQSHSSRSGMLPGFVIVMPRDIDRPDQLPRIIDVTPTKQPPPEPDGAW